MEEQWISMKSINLFKKLLKNDVTILSFMCFINYYSIFFLVCLFLVSLWKLEI